MAIVRHGQNLIDIALQHCGAYEAVFDIAMKNRLSITDSVPVGKELTTPAVLENSVVSRYAAMSVVPATDVTDDSFEVQTGIEYFTIGYDFIVS